MIHAKRYGRLLLWFIPAIAAFLNAQALKMRDRPPLEFVKPLTWRMEGTAHSGGRGAMPVFGYQAGQDFMAQGPAELHVSIRTGFLEVARLLAFRSSGTLRQYIPGLSLPIIYRLFVWGRVTITIAFSCMRNIARIGCWATEHIYRCVSYTRVHR